MEMNEMINIVSNTAISVVVIVFFMYRDLKYIAQLQTTLTTLVDTVNTLKECVHGLETKWKDDERVSQL